MDSFKIKKGLGRGLSSLIGDTKVDTNTNKLSISEIVRNRYQPRKNFDQENLDVRLNLSVGGINHIIFIPLNVIGGDINIIDYNTNEEIVCAFSIFRSKDLSTKLASYLGKSER